MKTCKSMSSHFFRFKARLEIPINAPSSFRINGPPESPLNIFCCVIEIAQMIEFGSGMSFNAAAQCSWGIVREYPCRRVVSLARCFISVRPLPAVITSCNSRSSLQFSGNTAGWIEWVKCIALGSSIRPGKRNCEFFFSWNWRLSPAV